MGLATHCMFLSIIMCGDCNVICHKGGDMTENMGSEKNQTLIDTLFFDGVPIMELLGG